MQCVQEEEMEFVKQLDVSAMSNLKGLKVDPWRVLSERWGGRDKGIWSSSRYECMDLEGGIQNNNFLNYKAAVHWASCGTIKSPRIRAADKQGI